MHEMAIASDLIRQVVDTAEQHKATRVREIELEVGAMRLVVLDALRLAFEAVTEGTVAEGATLTLVEIPPRAECRVCEHSFEPAIDCYLCPRCEKADVKIVAGNDIILRSLSCDTNEEISDP